MRSGLVKTNYSKFYCLEIQARNGLWNTCKHAMLNVTLGNIDILAKQLLEFPICLVTAIKLNISTLTDVIVFGDAFAFRRTLIAIT